MAKKKKRLRMAAVIFVFFLLAVMGWAWSVWTRIHDNLPAADDYIRDPSIRYDPDKNITNVLIVGVDSENDTAGRADSILVMSINRDTGEAALISIPRDSLVEIPGRGWDKINHAMVYQGVSLIRATVEKLFGVPVHHYMFTNFSGFKNFVDSLGGVTLEVERTVEYGGIKVEQGLQMLTGEQALVYVRFRNDQEGDFGRMRRQQQFLKAVAAEITRISNIVKLPGALEQFSRFVRTDMTITQLLSFGRSAGRIGSDTVEMIQLKGSPVNIKGASYIRLNDKFLQQTVKRYLLWEE